MITEIEKKIMLSSIIVSLVLALCCGIIWNPCVGFGLAIIITTLRPPIIIKMPILVNEHLNFFLCLLEVISALIGCLVSFKF